MIFLITGAPGSGKTKTAQYLMETTQKSALVDGDYLLGINPQNHTESEMVLRYKNIASLAENFYHAGYFTIFISFVYAGPNAIDRQIDLLTSLDRVLVFGLIPDEKTLRKRHREDNYKRESIESSIEISKKISAMENVVKIDNTKLSVQETATRIKELGGIT